MDPAELTRRFAYRPPTTPDRTAAHATLRGACAGLAAQITDLCPPGREQALALTKVEEAMFWANAALARQQ
ncbi:Acb2/Tad1 domain-containing protein [Streptomyces sp. enrichment culture]|uniref:Acb2/Tad1 domain-containing protein n=1 Tax=Streptomyces sp. enrichment culture TaxID=1795815 RepID=UPI003F579E8D